jgi:hypothetical protein
MSPGRQLTYGIIQSGENFAINSHIVSTVERFEPFRG